MTHRVLGILTLFAALATPVSASAQGPGILTLTPYAGVYLPAADLVSNQQVRDPGPLDPETFAMGQQTGLAVGLRASRSLSSKIWLELELQYAWSAIEATGTRREPFPEPTQTLDARVITIGADVLYELFRAPFTPFAIHVLGGLGLTLHGGEFFDLGGGFFESLDGGSSLNLILGAGLRYDLSPSLGLRFDIRDYVYPYKQSSSAGEFDSELQNDLWITGGLEIRL